MSTQITLNTLHKMKQKGEKITSLTAYDYPFAKIADEAGIHMILVGDSLGNVVQGEASTLGVTMEQMIYHTRIVSKAVRRAMIVADMPFMSYQVSVEQAVTNAGRFLKETRAAAVKLEGGGHRKRHHSRHYGLRHPGSGPYRSHAPVGSCHGRIPGAAG